MMYWSVLASLAAVLPYVNGIAFQEPAPTATSPNRAAFAFEPETTPGPSVQELKKRQTNQDPSVCGWVDGDFGTGVSCSVGRTCMLYKTQNVGMAGCCVGSDYQNCGWTNQCIDYSRYNAGNCGSDCLLNTFIRKCTDSAAPYCVTWTYPGDNVRDYGCTSTSTSTVTTILQRATDHLGDTTQMALPTLTGNAVAVTGDVSKTVKKIAIGLIVGVVVAVIFVLVVIIAGVCFCLKKRKKQRQIAANAQIVANAQANRPQSMYPAQALMQQPVQGQYNPAMPPQSPQVSGYFPPQGQTEQKFNGHTSVQEFAMSPISSPSTPAPAYSQPYGAPAVPPLPTQTNPSVQPYYSQPANNVSEVEAIGVSRPPPQGNYQTSFATPQEANAASVQSKQPGNVYEMGQGR